MKITITARKCTPTDIFKQRAEKKLTKIERFFDENSEAKITVSAEKARKIVEITVANHGIIFRAEESASDMTDALDGCIDSLIRKIRKNKTRIEKSLKKGAFDAFAGEAPVEEEKEFNIVRKKQVPVKPQHIEEAVLQMNMLGHKFYMFINAATDEVNVVYRRDDGGYGLLEPEVE